MWVCRNCSYSRTAAAVAVAAAIVVLAGCGGGDGGSNGQQSFSGGRAWTFMVFMNADNNLEGESGDDLDEMARAGYSPNVAVVVERDVKSIDGSDRIVLTDGGPRVVERLPEQDMGSAETLSEFVRWAMASYPAEHYCLVIWNHGTGWRGVKEPLTRGVSYDETNGSYLNMERLKAGTASSVPLDIVGFDACVMAMVEVAYQIRENALYMVGSEHDEPASGWNYTQVLSRLYANPGMGAAALSRIVVQSYASTYDNGGAGVTQSAMDLSQIEDLASVIDRFAGALVALQAGRSKSIRDARDATQRFSYDDYRDLADFARQIDTRLEDAAVRSAAQEVMAAHERAVIANAASGSEVQRAMGLSVFLPQSREYSAFSSNYERIDFAAAAPGWTEFLKTY